MMLDWAPKFDRICTVTLTLGQPLTLSTTGPIERFIPVTGGTVAGSRLNGKVLGHGGDRQTDHGTYARLDAHQLLETDDGALIELSNSGLRVASEEVKAQLRSGLPVAFDAYYMRFACFMRTAHPDYQWLNHKVMVAAGAKQPEGVILEIFELL
jgi:hypothetical protein